MIGYIYLRLLLWKLAWLPLPLARFTARVHAHLFALFLPKLRRVGLRNLELAGIPNREAVMSEVYDSIGRISLAFARFPGITSENVGEWIRYEGLDNYLDAKKKGRGVLVATAHLGNWELSAFSHALMTEPMNVVVRPLDNPRIDALVEHYRTLSGNKVIHKKDAARGILKALAAGEAVGLLIDQNTMPQEGVFIDFFGVKACANAAFVKFAHRSSAPVVPGFALWNERERKYILRFYPEVPMSGDVQVDTQRVHTQLESVIREHPGQWLWIHRRWKTRPPGEPPIY